MKKANIFILFLLIGTALNAQKKPITNPVLDFTYFVLGEGGANGLTVVYNPENGYYYCIQAGNAGFPLEIFTQYGESIYTTTAKKDVRGFWYNSKLKCFEGTMYLGGTFKMYIDESGYPSNPVTQTNSTTFMAPTEQTQVVCNVAKGEMYAFDNKCIHVYNQKTNKFKKKIVLKKCPSEWEYINPAAMFYTGQKNYEFGLYDIVNYKVILFNAKGVYTESIQIPFDAPPIEWFRLGYANDRVFLYDGDNRAWFGYKIFGDASGS